MESWFCSCWRFLWMVIFLFRNIPAELASPPPYTIHHTLVSFDQAMEDCSPGVLTTLATDQEAADILQLVSKSGSPSNQNEFTFWVSLRKVKDGCVVPTLPLRGFKWTEDGSEASEVSRWTEEPKHTCTSVLCAALKVELLGSTVTGWGLIPRSCKNTHQFICKVGESVTQAIPEPSTPPAPEPSTSPAHEPSTSPAHEPSTSPAPEPSTSPAHEPSTSPAPEPSTSPAHEPSTSPAPEPSTSPAPEPSTPTSPKPPKPAAPEPPKPEPRPATQKPEPALFKPDLHIQGPETESDLKHKNGSELQGPDPNSGSEPALASDSCQHPLIMGARSLSLDPNNSSKIQVECWSNAQLELHCSGRPAVWRLLDDSPANFTTICLPCEDGFQKDTSGDCVDINECSADSASCRHTCLNTEGSYRCVCSDKSGTHQDEGSPLCMDTTITGDNNLLSGVLLPILVSVAVLVVLVVVVVVTVKCCLMRRSKKRAIKKAEKMAMKSNDSFQTANERAAI